MDELRRIRRELMEAARMEPGFDEAVADARRLGFGCEGYRPRRLLCRLLRRHVHIGVYRTFSSDGSFSTSAHCCNITGFHYPRQSPAPWWDIRVPQVTARREPSPWEPGSTAFWLDPQLWDRTPEVDGRPGICWMFLPTKGSEHEEDDPTHDSFGPLLTHGMY